MIFELYGIPLSVSNQNTTKTCRNRTENKHTIDIFNNVNHADTVPVAAEDALSAEAEEENAVGRKEDDFRL
jgi:hypothetical protein